MDSSRTGGRTVAVVATRPRRRRIRPILTSSGVLPDAVAHRTSPSTLVAHACDVRDVHCPWDRTQILSLYPSRVEAGGVTRMAALDTLVSTLNSGFLAKLMATAAAVPGAVSTRAKATPPATSKHRSPERDDATDTERRSLRRNRDDPIRRGVSGDGREAKSVEKKTRRIRQNLQRECRRLLLSPEQTVL